MKKAIAAALSALAITIGGVAASAPEAVAAPSAPAAWQSYDVGVYPILQCDALGTYHRLVHAQNGRRSFYQCLPVGSPFPVQQFLLRVHVLV
ncbi:hypothetical protein [Streptomyces sp. MNP-20]|uniref:hypothetical protein n=1 Tax=Streptomyces sp. MNP-20 TaxID=2721165 RepID=UPI00155564A0|nr:hypothetical protein [Streptomyces sp. MNP-20]